MCVPCQTIIWNDRVAAMLKSVSSIAKIHLAGGEGWPGDGWGMEWYEKLEAACGEMEKLLDELVATKKGK